VSSVSPQPPEYPPDDEGRGGPHQGARCGIQAHSAEPSSLNRWAGAAVFADNGGIPGVMAILYFFAVCFCRSFFLKTRILYFLLDFHHPEFSGWYCSIRNPGFTTRGFVHMISIWENRR